MDAQLGQFKAAGSVPIFREKVTGARADRKERLKMLKQLAAGGLVTVTGIDRLARSTFDLLPPSSISPMVARNSGHWPSRGRIQEETFGIVGMNDVNC